MIAYSRALVAVGVLAPRAAAVSSAVGRIADGAFAAGGVLAAGAAAVAAAVSSGVGASGATWDLAAVAAAVP